MAMAKRASTSPNPPFLFDEEPLLRGYSPIFIRSAESELTHSAQVQRLTLRHLALQVPVRLWLENTVIRAFGWLSDGHVTVQCLILSDNSDSGPCGILT